MPKRLKNAATTANTTGATVSYEAELWHMADTLRGSMDAAEHLRPSRPGQLGEDKNARDG